MCISNMNTRHESFPSRDGSPRGKKINRLASVETSSTQLEPQIGTRLATTINYEAIKINFDGTQP